jgi:cytochrome b subunit of formate dehydrogenase
MINGHVSMEFAESHHALWVEEERQEKESTQMMDTKRKNFIKAQ